MNDQYIYLIILIGVFCFLLAFFEEVVMIAIIAVLMAGTLTLIGGMSWEGNTPTLHLDQICIDSKYCTRIGERDDDEIIPLTE